MYRFDVSLEIELPFGFKVTELALMMSCDVTGSFEIDLIRDPA